MEPAYWLLTWRTYGTWLPGDRRGFVNNVRGADGHGERHNVPGTECDHDLPALERYAREQMKREPIYLTLEQARMVAADFRSSAAYRGWSLLALAVMANHVHLVVAAPEEVLTDRLLQVFKSYASRKLNGSSAKPSNGTWWAASGSRWRLPNEQAVEAAVAYTQNQPNPLVIWMAGFSVDPTAPTDSTEPGTTVPG